MTHAGRTFLVSYSYPPMNRPRAVQVGRLVEHLAIPVILICARDDDRAADPSLESLRKSEHLAGFRVVPTLRWAWTLSRIVKRITKQDLWVPDPYLPWAMRVAQILEREEGIGPHDRLVTFGHPMSSHLAGLRLKRRTGVAWMAHFSDPWMDNPLLPKPWWSKGLHRRREQAVFDEANRIVFTSQQTIELVGARQSPAVRAKMRVLPHAYSQTLYPIDRTPPVDVDRRLVVRCLGGFYGARTPQPLLDALMLLMGRRPELFARIRFEFIGRVPSAMSSTPHAEALRAKDVVQFVKPVNYIESLRLMAKSDALFLIDAPAEVSVFLPSKLIDYIGANRFIFGISPPGAAADLIHRLGGWTADPSKPHEIEDALENWLDSLQNGIEPEGPRREVALDYEASRVAAKFIGLLEEMKE